MALLALTVVGLFFATSASAQAPGSLDTTFSDDGKQITDFGGYDESVQGSVLQPDGKIVVAGFTNADGPGHNFALARYNADASLDTTFSGDGKQTTDFAVTSEFAGSYDGGLAVALQPDGKIVVAGYRYAADGYSDFALVRYNADGSLDTDFGDGGKQTTDFLGMNDFAQAVAVQPDGKFVLAGQCECGANGASVAPNFALARYNADGSPDTTFSDDGKQTNELGVGDEGARALTLQPDGKIVVAGYIDYHFGVARYNADGSLDTDFADAGKQTTTFGDGEGEDTGQGVAVQPDGKIVVAGNTIDFGRRFALARYNADGSPDTDFGDGGEQMTEFGNSSDAGSGVALQADGKIVVAGSSEGENGKEFALARYNSDASLDTSFSGDGKQTTDFGSDGFGYQQDAGNAVALQPDGKIVLAGDADGGRGRDFALARYNGAPDTTAPDTSITAGPSGTVRSTSASFGFSTSESESTFQCRRDGGSWGSCTSPKAYASLSHGSHTFEVVATDGSGNRDATPAKRTWKVDTVAPRVTSVSPASGATRVSAATNVLATFSEQMRPANINATTVTLRRKGTTTKVTAPVAYSSTPRHAVLNPNVNLRPGATYIATVTTGARDLAGNQLAATKQWSFAVRP